MTYPFDSERAKQILGVLDGLTYPDAIRLLSSVMFLIDNRSKQEFLVSSDAGMCKLIQDYSEQIKKDIAAEQVVN